MKSRTIEIIDNHIEALEEEIEWYQKKNIEWQEMLEVEEKQVCEWKGVKYSPPGFKQYWIYYPPHNVSHWISAIGKEDYIFCPTCGERIKYVESEE